MLPGTLTEAFVAAERVRLAFEAAGRAIGGGNECDRQYRRGLRRADGISHN